MATVLGFTVVDYGSSLIGNYKIPGAPVSLSMRKEIAPILVGFCRDFHAQVEPLRTGWCWGFNPKHIEGSSVWSNHAWGGAVDLNAPLHAMGKVNTFTPADRAAIAKLLTKYSYQGTKLIRWGGNYTGRKDDMHFEINVSRTVAHAAVQAMSSALTYKPGQRVLSQGMKGADVGFVQGKVGTKADNDFGVNTSTAVKKFQKSKNLKQDAVVGPATWTALGVKPTV